MDYEIVAEGLAFPEGPVVMPDGSVVVVEMLGGRVTRCWPGGKETILETADGPNGAALGPDGALYICNNGGIGHRGPNAGPECYGNLARLDLATGKAEVLYDSCDGRSLSAPNDLMFDCDGNVWFTDLGKVSDRGKAFGGLYCARSDGSAITRIKDGALSYNGVGVSPDMQTVYVADTYQARVYAFDRKIEPQQPRFVATVPGMIMLDSLAMTAAGNVCVATLLPGGVATVTPEGQVSTRPFDDAYVTNIAFGGEDMRDAWITFSQRGLLIKARWQEPGMRLIYNG